MKRIMITCAGSQKKWNGHLGVPSHLVRDRNGETILGRIVRQVQERGYEMNQILVFHPEIQGYYTPGTVSVLTPVGRYETEFHTTQDWWLRGDEDRNVMLLGDTWFTEEAMDQILGHEGDGIRFFGREDRSRITGSPYGELFGYSWNGMNNGTLERAMEKLHDMKKQGKVWRFCGWEVLYQLQGQTVKKDRHFEHRVSPWIFTEINDETDDVDFPIDYVRHPMFGGKRD